MVNLRSSLTGPAAYICLSYAITTLYVLDCVTTYREFYPVIIYLTNSAIFQILMVNTFAASAVALWKVSVWFFFGSLTTGEADTLTRAASLHASDCVIALLYSEQPLVGRYSAGLVLTTVWQILHHVERERARVVGSLPPNGRKGKVLGLICFATVSTVVNITVIVLVGHTLNEGSRRMMMAKYVFVIRYMHILITNLHVISLLMFGAWRSGDLSHSGFFVRTFWRYVASVHFVLSFSYVSYRLDPPFMLLRTFLQEAMSFMDTTIRLQRYLRLTRITRALATATAADLTTETRCSICYEDMVPNGTAKRLACSHCYHTECLQQWFQSNSTCPYCRADLLRHKPPTRADAQPQPPAPAPGQEPQPQPQPQLQPQQQQQQQPAAQGSRDAPPGVITGDALVDAALEEALANDQGNHLNVVVAYGKYREQMAAMRQADRHVAEEEAKRREQRKAKRDARHGVADESGGHEKEPARAESPSGSSGSEAPTPTAKEVAAPSTLAALRLAREAREARMGSSASAKPSAPPTASEPGAASASPPSEEHQQPTAATTAAAKMERDAARLRAYEEYRHTLKKAERKLKATLQALDERGDT